MDLMQIRRMLMTLGGNAELWKQKQVTAQSAIALGSDFANIITNNIPSGTTFAIIVKDNLDDSTFINNQLITGTYNSSDTGCQYAIRYRSNSYNGVSGANTWTSTYAITASQGDSYTIFYQ